MTDQAGKADLHALKTAKEARIGDEVGREAIAESVINHHGHKGMKPVSHSGQIYFPAVEGIGNMTAVEVAGMVDASVVWIHKRVVVNRVDFPLKSRTMLPQGIQSRSQSLGNTAKRVGVLNGLIGSNNTLVRLAVFLAYTFTDLIQVTDIPAPFKELATNGCCPDLPGVVLYPVDGLLKGIISTLEDL